MTCVGELVNDFSLQNCETGQMVNMYSLMEDSLAFWIVATASWCCAPANDWLLHVISETDARYADGLRSVIVMGENDVAEPPSLADCRAFAALYDDDASRFYIDHDWLHSFATTFANIYVYPDEGGDWYMPWNAVLRSADTSSSTWIASVRGRSRPPSMRCCRWSSP